MTSKFVFVVVVLCCDIFFVCFILNNIVFDVLSFVVSVLYEFVLFFLLCIEFFSRCVRLSI